MTTQPTPTPDQRAAFDLPPLPVHPELISPSEYQPTRYSKIPSLYEWAKSYAIAAVQLDRQQRGEPVAWLTQCIKGQAKGKCAIAKAGKPTINIAYWSQPFPVFAQPAAPAVKESLTVAEPVHHQLMREALESAKAGLEWYRERCSEAVDGSDDEADQLIKTALAWLAAPVAAQSSVPESDERPYNDPISFSKRILTAVDIYHERPDRMNRNALRSMLMSEFEDALSIATPPVDGQAQQDADKGDALTHAARDVLAERQRQIDAECWTPGEPRRNLVKAGALILAEIEQLDRQTARAQQGGQS